MSGLNDLIDRMQDRMNEKVTDSGNVFRDLGFNEEEAAKLTRRADKASCILARSKRRLTKLERANLDGQWKSLDRVLHALSSIDCDGQTPNAIRLQLFHLVMEMRPVLPRKRAKN